MSGEMGCTDSRSMYLIQSDLDGVHCATCLDKRAHVLVERKRKCGIAAVDVWMVEWLN